MTPPTNHLDTERVQEFLDGDLSSADTLVVREHLEECAACSRAVEAWHDLFRRMEALPELSPTDGFRDRVLAQVRMRRPLPHRLLAAIRGTAGRRTEGARHLTSEGMLAYLDRAVGGRRQARFERHLDGCERCRLELAAWTSLLRELDAIPRLTPSNGFATGVMARLEARRANARTKKPADSGESARGGAARTPAGGSLQPIGSAAPSGSPRSFWPRTRRAWALAGGFTVVPLAALVAGFTLLFSNPLVTPANVLTFLWWQATGMVESLASGAVQAAVGSPFVFALWNGVQRLAGEPALMLLMGLGLSAGTGAAAWILYRNMNPAPAADRGYVNGSA